MTKRFEKASKNLCRHAQVSLAQSDTYNITLAGVKMPWRVMCINNGWFLMKVKKNLCIV